MTCAKQKQCQHGDGCFMATDYDVARCTAFKPLVQTNEEWFCNLSTKEKAKVIVNIHNLANIDQIEWWLKEKHE